MRQNEETRRGGHRGRASEGVCVAADRLEDTRALIDRQAAWLARRLGLTVDRARLLAGLAFATGGQR
jgi:hypothetical protein